ncbi:transcription antitermination factor NusB [Desulfohalovibrio reitneri]|uniref:transcription antitermination factor NusB n=1 Tax=Desulfohalovibrio reitneri TaxID=1307759 RepID=UPI0004A786EF|nr:transcription antitermination factor NusB [Desulfohalovibrio reitneri]
MAQQRTGARSEGRAKAFQILYGLTYVPPARGLDSLPHVLAESPALWNEDVSERARQFAAQLVEGVWSRMDELDEVITRFSTHWKVNRIGRIELTVLRLALYEMLYVPDMPLKVAINEGVELAKSYGDEASSTFVNGILDAAARAVNKGELGTGKEI